MAVALVGWWACLGSGSSRAGWAASDLGPKVADPSAPGAAEHSAAAGPESAPSADPVEPGDGGRVRLRDSEGAEVVGRILVRQDDELAVLLPDGRLVQVPSAETRPTDESFAPLEPKVLAERLTAGPFRGFRSRVNRRYVFVYNTSEEFFIATSRILGSMYGKLLTSSKRLFGRADEPEVPLVVLMFRTEDEFRRFRELPAGIVAYYDQISNYVVLYEQSQLAVIAPELAVKQSISTIAHEGVHQLLHNFGVQARLSQWPMWIAEGLPEYCAPTSVERRTRWKGMGEVNDLRMSELDRFIRGRGDGAQGELVRQTVEAPQLTSTGYAAAWALTHFLATKRKAAFAKYLHEVCRLGPLETHPDRGAALFRECFGDDFARLERDLVEHLRSLSYVDPIDHQTHFVVTLEVDLGQRISREYGVTTSPAAVEQWQKQALVSVPSAARSRARFQVQAFADKQSAQQYAHRWLESR